VKDLEDTVRLKNKQIHQLLEDVDQVEQDNTSKIDQITIKTPYNKCRLFWCLI